MKKIRFFLLIFVALIGFISCVSNYNDQRDRSSHFIDGKFQNINYQEMPGLGDLIKMLWQTPMAEWPEWIETEFSDTPPEKVEDDTVRITVINHATVLIQGVGFNVLADPVFSDRASPFSFAGPKRVRNPAIRFEDIPKIDAIIISHDHYDHLDIVTIAKLIQRDQPKVYLGLGVGRHLESMFNVIEMDWWQQEAVGEGLKLTFVPVQHFSGRGLFDRMSTLWGGYVLEIADKKVYFGGDSGYADHYLQTFDKFGPMDVALLPIGAYEPRWFMGYVHMNPQEAVQAHLDLQAKRSIGIHYGTFQLTGEPIDEPKEKLAIEREKAGLTHDDFAAIEFGETVIVR